MDSRPRGGLLVFVSSLLTFAFLDYLASSLFVQWNGGPFPYLERAVFFIVLVAVRTVIAEGLMLEAFGGHLRKKNVLLSSVIFGPPLLTVQLVTGTNTVLGFLSSLSPFPPRTFFYAIFMYLILSLLLESSRLCIIWLIREANLVSRLNPDTPQTSSNAG